MLLYMQIYLFIGIVYTIYVYPDFYRKCLKRCINDNYLLYCTNTKQFIFTVKAVCLLLVFVWPIHLGGQIYKINER